MEAILRLVYVSRARVGFPVDDLADILSRSRRNNAVRGITGLLVYSQGSFFQVLEGDPATVHSLYERICVDPRHTDASLILAEYLPQRSFPLWNMAYAALHADEVLGRLGVPALSAIAADAPASGQGLARKLLESFLDCARETPALAAGPGQG